MLFDKNAKAEVETVDRYKRYVAIVTCNGIGRIWFKLRNGMAWVYVQYAKDKKYFDAENETKYQTGLWSMNNPTPPWKFRKIKGLL